MPEIDCGSSPPGPCCPVSPVLTVDPVCKLGSLELREDHVTPPLSLFAAQSCVDESRVQEHVVAAGPQEPPYRLNCPLEPPSALFKPAWQKDCRHLPEQDGKAHLDFASVSLEDQGNYTCVHQGNSMASFTQHLLVKGACKYAFPLC